MPTLIPDPPPAEVKALLERRRRAGADRLDEVWEGVYHMVPAPTGEHAYVHNQLTELLSPPARAAGLVPAMGEFNLGENEDDFRVPDGGLHRGVPRGTWHATAAMVVEIVSPGDESWEKLPFYAAHNVEELLIVDPHKQSVSWLALAGGEYREVEHSGLIDLGSAELHGRIDWPERDSGG